MSTAKSSFQLQQKIQTIVIDCLKTAFINNPDFPYSSDRTSTSIDILGAFPKVLPVYPCIRVSTPKLGRLPRTFGDNYLGDIRDTNNNQTGLVYGGAAPDLGHSGRLYQPLIFF